MQEKKPVDPNGNPEQRGENFDNFLREPWTESLSFSQWTRLVARTAKCHGNSRSEPRKRGVRVPIEIHPFLFAWANCSEVVGELYALHLTRRDTSRYNDRVLTSFARTQSPSVNNKTLGAMFASESVQQSIYETLTLKDTGDLYFFFRRRFPRERRFPNVLNSLIPTSP